MSFGKPSTLEICLTYFNVGKKIAEEKLILTDSCFILYSVTLQTTNIRSLYNFTVTYLTLQ